MSSAVVEIRSMTLTDVPAVVEIERNSHKDPWNEGSFERELGSSHSYLYVAQRFAKIEIEPLEIELPSVVGYVCFWKAADEIQILNLAVHPSFRRQGIGRALLSQALKSGFELQGRIAVLEVRQYNEPARHLYMREGFHVVGVRPHYYEKGARGAAVLMELDLTQSEK
jgi:ribosomal-protein-alanine N-acetyltransferase